MKKILTAITLALIIGLQLTVGIALAKDPAPATE